MNSLVQDIRYGLRMLAKSPALALVAILSPRHWRQRRDFPVD